MRVIILCLVALAFNVLGGFAGITRTNKNARIIAENFFIQPVDNFNATDTRTWKMQYFTEDGFFSNNGPIFLLLGGQSKITLEALVGGYMNMIGSELHAYIVHAEHRYYGKSQVTSTTSTEDLQYLTVEQAMADIINLVKSLKQQPMFKDSKVIVFGGGYAGDLATWMRLKYPDIITGAVASGAPVLAKVDFSESFEVVRDNLIEKGGEPCANAVNDGINETSQWITSDIGAAMVAEKFKLCLPTDSSNPLDVQSFYSLVAHFMSDFMTYTNDILLSLMCGILSGEGGGSPMDRLAEAFTLFTGEECNVADYETIKAGLANTELSSSTAEKRLQLYQSCTQLGQFQTTTSKNQSFGENVPISYYLSHLCPDAFGSGFGIEAAESGVSKTNAAYGGLTPNVTKVVSIHGSIDPWYKLGISVSLSESSPAFLAVGESHMADFENPAPSDSNSLKQARDIVRRNVIAWVMENN